MRYYFEEASHDSYTGMSTMIDGKILQYRLQEDGSPYLQDIVTGECYPIVYSFSIPDTDELMLFVTEV